MPSSITCAFAVAALGAAQVQAEPAAAGAASAPGGEALQEIVVTATRRSEDLQSVGLSLTAFTTEQLESKGVEQFFDYGNSIPNLSFAIDAADGSLAARGIALRGIQGSNTTGFYSWPQRWRVAWSSACCSPRRGSLWCGEQRESCQQRRKSWDEPAPRACWRGELESRCARAPATGF
ncbi:MAG: hypothetical protein ACLPTF_03440, partial [Steroidobacteraceae bacterium]